MCKYVEGCHMQNLSGGSNVGVKQFLVTGCGASGTTSLSFRLQRAGVLVHHEKEGAVQGRALTDGLVSWSARCSSLLPESVEPRLPTELANAPGCAWPYRPCSFLYRRVLHQVRHPMAWARSWLAAMHGPRVVNRTVCSATPSPCWGSLRTFYNDTTLPSFTHHNSGLYSMWMLINYYTWPNPLFESNEPQGGGGAHFPPPQREIVLAMRHYLSWNAMAERVADARFAVETTSLFAICTLGGVARPERCRESEVNTSDLADYLGRHINKHASRVDHERAREIERSATWERLRELDPQLEAQLWAMAQRYGYARHEPAQGVAAHHR